MSMLCVVVRIEICTQCGLWVCGIVALVFADMRAGGNDIYLF